MKQILLVLLLILSTSVFSQTLKNKTVLGKFVLGYDTEKSLSEKIGFDEINIDYEYDGKAEITFIRINEYMYKFNAVKIVLVLINDDLYSVRYYPKNDKNFYKYRKYLSTEYNIMSKNIEKSWFNKYIEVDYDMDGNYDESFIHYYIPLLNKYPQYKNL